MQNALFQLIISLHKITSSVPLNHNSPEHRSIAAHQNKIKEHQIRQANVTDGILTRKDDEKSY